MKPFVLHNEDILSTDDSFVKEGGDGVIAEFSQSIKWLEILLAEKKEVSLHSVSDDRVALRGMMTKKSFFFNKLNYQYCPRGPIARKDLDKESLNKAFLEMTKEIKKSSSPVFLRFEPSLDLFSKLDNDAYNLKKTIDLQPQKTLLLDLKLSEEEILKAMHQKTRYNIRLAKRKGVEIFLASSFSENKASALMDFDSFWFLLKKTADRDGFKIHPRSHYLQLLSNNDLNRLYLAKHNGVVIAGGIFSFFANTATYLHGASDNEFRSLMAPYLLQFEVIKKAQAEGYRYYDFFGVDKLKWPGVTRFKMGFGGFIYEYAGTYDLVFKPFYYFIYQMLRRVRRLF